MSSTYFAPAEKVPQEIIDRVSKLNASLLCDGMKQFGVVREGCMDAAIMPVTKGMEMVGTAFAVDTDMGDNFPLHMAIYSCPEDYILVVSGKAFEEKPYMGILMAKSAELLGIKGIVIDGYIRDSDELAEINLPIYARGVMQRGPGKTGPGAINVPIVCGGVPVNPGDLIVGDCDGVTVVPRDKIEGILNAAEVKADYEEKRKELFLEYAKRKLEGKELPDLMPAWVKEKLALEGESV